MSILSRHVVTRFHSASRVVGGRPPSLRRPNTLSRMRRRTGGSASATAEPGSVGRGRRGSRTPESSGGCRRQRATRPTSDRAALLNAAHARLASRGLMPMSPLWRYAALVARPIGNLSLPS
jgi:hypothetical protein